MNTERADAATRSRITSEDRAKYTGLAQHPRAREWLKSQYIEARDKADAATDDSTRERWMKLVDARAAELRRMGVVSDAA